MDIFEQDHHASAAIVRGRQNQRSVAQSDMIATGTFLCFVSKSKDAAGRFTTVDTLVAPPSVINKSAKTGGTYKDKLEIRFHINDMKTVKDVCEPVDSGDAGAERWRIMADVGYLGGGKSNMFDTKQFIKDHREAAWALDATTGTYANMDELHTNVRKYISADGVMLQQKWVMLDKNSKMRFKVPDSSEEKRIFRAKPPQTPRVQPFAPIELTKVSANVWAKAEKQTRITDPAAVVPEGESPVTHEVWVLNEFCTYTCKGDVRINEDYDPNMADSEQQHANSDPDSHHLVPVAQMRNGVSHGPTQAYFFVGSRMTPHRRDNIDPQAQGVTVMRDSPDDVRDLLATFDDQDIPKCVIRFTVYQWFGRPPNTLEEVSATDKYCVKALTRKDDDKAWRSFGITDPHVYAAIIGANSVRDKERPQMLLPVHLHLAHWKNATLADENNLPDKLNNKPELANMRGYYVFGIETLVPDFVRHFQNNGLRVSQAWVEKEFDNWIITHNGRRTFEIKAVNPSEQNPLNARGTDSAVFALGNGQLLHPGTTNHALLGLGKYHAFTGNAVSVLDGTRDFYVLTNYTPTMEELNKFYGRFATEPEGADAYIGALASGERKLDTPFMYWIYAVKRDTKRATVTTYDKSTHPPLSDPPATPVVGVKRAAEDALDDNHERERSEHKSPTARAATEPADDVDDDNQDGDDDDDDQDGELM